MAATSMVHIRVDEQVKTQAAMVLNAMRPIRLGCGAHLPDAGSGGKAPALCL